ncbi:MAG: ion transporter [Bacteroidales bacterium]|nr:ion transporter [Bacteroidales bacterium]
MATMQSKLKQKLYEIIFKADTRPGKIFDISLLSLIIISILAVMLESVSSIDSRYGTALNIIEWVVTFFFSVEYILRIWIVKQPRKYIFSFYGIIDLMAILPSFLEIFFAGAHGMIIIRALRLLRVFRLFKLTRYTSESNQLMRALKASRTKISIFLFTVVTIVIVIGTLMYLVEGEANGFTSIPKSIYWAITTLTTVGYGDIAPGTNLGQFLASIVMIIGYAIIAVPTGIVTAEISRTRHTWSSNQRCPVCLKEGHDSDAKNCKFCGSELNTEGN